MKKSSPKCKEIYLVFTILFKGLVLVRFFYALKEVPNCQQGCYLIKNTVRNHYNMLIYSSKYVLLSQFNIVVEYTISLSPLSLSLSLSPLSILYICIYIPGIIK